jgi:hypothetical protein
MEQNPFARRFHFYFNLAMVLIYTAAGILLLFFVRFESIPKTNTLIIGCVLLLYAAYRTYKLIRERRESLRENDSSNAAQ